MKQLGIWIFLIFVVLSFLLSFLDSQKYLNGAKSLLQIPLSPLESAAYNLQNSIGDAFSVLTFWKSGEARIKNLEQKNLELGSKLGEAERLRVENEELRKQLGVNLLFNKKRLPAPVLGAGRYLVLGVGSRDGVKLGKNVVYLDNLVGVVKNLTDRTSFVQMPTDAMSKIAVKVGPSGGTRGIVNGQFNSAIALDQVSQSEEINVDDLVQTTGDDQIYEPNLTIGKIKKIVSSKGDLFRKAEVVPLIKFNELQTVFVILD